MAETPTPGRGRPARPGTLTPQGYWAQNLRYLAVLLAVWFIGSFGAGILFARQLDRVRIPGTGFPLGFWFAQQGAIYLFLIVIFVYVRLMNRLDDRFERGPGGDA